MGLIDPSQDLRVKLSCIRIDRDHLAARVALEDGNHHLGPDPQGPADIRVLREHVGRREIHIDIRSEPSLVEDRSDFVAKLAAGLNRKQ